MNYQILPFFLSATTSTIGRSIESEDTAVIQQMGKWCFRNNGCYDAFAYPRNIEGSITILGEKKEV